MSALFFATPLGLFALAAVPAVAALYLYRRQRRARAVTALFLWGAPRPDATGGRRRDRIPPSLPLWLDLAAALLAALAAGGPMWRRAARPIVVVLDDSFVMRARGADARARELARALAADAVIAAGDSPRRLASLDDYRPAANRSDLAAALALAGPDADIRLFTNQPPDAVPRVGWNGVLHSLAGRGNNAAFTQVWPYADDGRERIALAWRFSGDAPAEVGLTLYDAEDAVLHRQTDTIPPGDAVAADFDAARVRRAALTCGDDVIAADSEVWLPPRPDDTVPYAVQGLPPRTAQAVTRALDAAGARRADGAPDLLATLEETDAAVPVSVRFLPPVRSGVALPPYLVDTADPLCRDLQLDAAVWIVADPAPAGAPPDPAIAAGPVPLAWRAGPGQVILNLDAERGSLINEPDWPVLWANLVDLARARLPGPRQTLFRPGENGAPRLPGRHRLGEVDIAVAPLYGDASDTTRLADADHTIAVGEDDPSGAEAVELTLPLLALAAAAVAANWRLSRREGGA